MLYLLFLALVGLVLPRQWEGSVKGCLSRTVALGRTWGNLQVVAFAVPYRPNRVYYRAAIARV